MRFAKRKWGLYFTFIDRKHFKVKILWFHKGGRLSNQYHNLRNELWLFLSGEDSGLWKYIACRELHTYHAEKPALILEIQYGEKCEESDIVRI